jgi:hypothetical protein
MDSGRRSGYTGHERFTISNMLVLPEERHLIGCRPVSPIAESCSHKEKTRELPKKARSWLLREGHVDEVKDVKGNSMSESQAQNPRKVQQQTGRCAPFCRMRRK